MEIVIKTVTGIGVEQACLRAFTRTFEDATAVTLEAALARLTRLCVGHPRSINTTSRRYELQVREQRGGRPLALTIADGDLEERVAAVRELIRLIVLASTAGDP